MLTVAIRQYGPTVHPDEFGFLTNGQALIGHDEAAIPTGSFYPAGYGIVTGLGALVSGSISGAYRFALLTNVVLAVLTAWYAGRLAQRGFGASRHMALVIIALVFVVPGTIVSAMFSWAETASRLAFLLFVGFVLRASKARSNGLVVGLGLFTGLMPALHGRFILLLPIVCLLFAWWWLRKEISFITAGSAVAVTAFSYVATMLPATILSLGGIAVQSRYIRASMLETLREGYVRTARAKGLDEGTIFYKHALRNSIRPLITGIGGLLPALIGGSVIVETIFAYPGMGRLGYEAVLERDYPMLVALNFIVAALVLAGNLASDLLYAVVDPRVRLE
jgi:ABC-type dipeptide/oligopeptide/nickel transport system permease component